MSDSSLSRERIFPPFADGKCADFFHDPVRCDIRVSEDAINRWLHFRPVLSLRSQITTNYALLRCPPWIKKSRSLLLFRRARSRVDLDLVSLSICAVENFTKTPANRRVCLVAAECYTLFDRTRIPTRIDCNTYICHKEAQCVSAIFKGFLDILEVTFL